jgi:hypothetical protein
MVTTSPVSAHFALKEKMPLTTRFSLSYLVKITSLNPQVKEKNWAITD